MQNIFSLFSQLALQIKYIRQKIEHKHIKIENKKQPICTVHLFCPTPSTDSNAAKNPLKRIKRINNVNNERMCV